MREPARRLFLLVGTALFAGCASSSGAPVDGASEAAGALTAPSPEGSLPPYFTVLPHQTDPAITNTDLQETYAAPADDRDWNGKLLVFLPGSIAQPNEYKTIVREAAAIGYYAVGVAYPNGAPTVIDPTLTEICENMVGGNGTPDCYGQIRRNRFDGTAEPNGTSTKPAPSGAFYDPYLIASPTDGIEHRLTALLQWLGAGNGSAGAAANWGSFVASGAPAYEKMVLAGHSQGGGEAAYIGMLRTVAGVVMFDSPEDAAVTLGVATASAAWLSSTTWATPLARYYGLVHEKDEFDNRIALAWKNLGANAPGGPFAGHGAACVDGATSSAGLFNPTYCAKSVQKPPYAGAHELYTNIAKITPWYFPFPYHSTPVADAALTFCKNSEHPVLAASWRQMLYAAGGFANVADPPPCE